MLTLFLFHFLLAYWTDRVNFNLSPPCLDTAACAFSQSSFQDWSLAVSETAEEPRGAYWLEKKRKDKGQTEYQR